MALPDAAPTRLRELTTLGTLADECGPDPVARQRVQVERRREHRYPANEIVEVEVIGSPGARLLGTIVDISRSGLRVEVAMALSRGTHIELILRNRAVIFGESCYARPRNGLYQVGVVIESVYFARVDGSRHADIKLLREFSRGGSLTTLQVLEVRSHLRDCEACREVVATFERTRTAGMHRS